MKGDCVVDDYKDTSSPVRVQVRAFDGDLSQSKEEAYEKHLKKQMRRTHVRKETSNNLMAHARKGSGMRINNSGMNVDNMNQSSSRMTRKKNNVNTRISEDENEGKVTIDFTQEPSIVDYKDTTHTGSVNVPITRMARTTAPKAHRGQKEMYNSQPEFTSMIAANRNSMGGISSRGPRLMPI